jgi:hypothetical protein
MPGGLLQLAAKGDEDAFFASSKPTDHSVFRSTFRKSTNYAVEPLGLTFLQDVNFGASASVSVGRLGDLLTGLTVFVTVRKQPGDFTAAYFPIEALFKEVALVIDGDIVERHTADWLRVYHTLHQPFDKAQLYTRLANFDPGVVSNGQPATQTFCVPLAFTFCRHLSAALPLIAMDFSAVSVKFTLATAEEVGLDPTVLDIKVFGEYAYVDTEERLMFRAAADTIIEQVQINTFTLPPGVPSSTSVSHFQAKFNFYRPIKCLYWFLKSDVGSHHGRYVGNPDEVPLAFTAHVGSPSGLCLVSPIPDALEPLMDSQLLFNDHERTPAMPTPYFSKMMPLRACAGQPVPGVCVFPFGTHLESEHSHGFSNFSRISEASLKISIKKNTALDAEVDTTTAKNIEGLNQLVVIGWGYNVLSVRNGRATVRFK